MTLIMCVQTVADWYSCYLGYKQELEEDKQRCVAKWLKNVPMADSVSIDEKIKFIEDLYFSNYIDLCKHFNKDFIKSEDLVAAGCNPIVAKLFAIDAYIKPITGKPERIRLTLNKRIKDKERSTVAGSFSARVAKHFSVDKLPVDARLNFFLCKSPTNFELVFECCGVVGAPLNRNKLQEKNMTHFSHCNSLLTDRFAFLQQFEKNVVLNEQQQVIMQAANLNLPCAVDTYMYYLYAFGLMS